jgi:GT2 family glycosyltransferase
VTVALGIIHDSQMDALFVRCLFQLLRDRDSEIAGAIFVAGGAGRLDNARNEVARRFLKTSAEWLLTLDTDMTFQTDQFDALVGAGSQDTPIVSGTYFVDESPPRVAAARTVKGTIDSISDWGEEKLVKVDWCGAGFMLIHRSVLEALGSEPYRQDVVAPSGALVGEDYAFCHRARHAGFPVRVMPSVFVGHIKPRVLGVARP